MRRISVVGCSIATLYWPPGWGVLPRKSWPGREELGGSGEISDVCWEAWWCASCSDSSSYQRSFHRWAGKIMRLGAAGVLRYWLNSEKVLDIIFSVCLEIKIPDPKLHSWRLVCLCAPRPWWRLTGTQEAVAALGASPVWYTDHFLPVSGF